MRWPYAVGSFARQYDLSSDDRRLLAIRDLEQLRVREIVVLDFLEGFKEVAPE